MDTSINFRSLEPASSERQKCPCSAGKTNSQERHKGQQHHVVEIPRLLPAQATFVKSNPKTESLN